uniref:Ig-like domain-containing protein n=1 Tax=Haplochromis burtoni TaxID=8153 RepID=A0A3Q2VBU4_HAPBU
LRGIRGISLKSPSALLVAATYLRSGNGKERSNISPHVSVMEGETVNITCCWTGKFERFRVNWLKNQTEIRSDQPNVFLKKEEKNCSSLNISNVRTEDSGTYICRVTVEIPSLTEAEGNGTVITVKTMGRSGTFDIQDKRNREEVKKVKNDDNTDQHIARGYALSIFGNPNKTCIKEAQMPVSQSHCPCHLYLQ